MDAAIFIAGGMVAGALLGGGAIGIITDRTIRLQRDALQAHESAFSAIAGRLVALRRNCFITNELGHRVRFFKASPERRAKAEQD